MITINLKLFKYGEFKETEKHNFNNDVDVNMWIQKQLEFTDKINIDSSDCGETLSKWTAQFKYKNKNYNINLNI